MKIRAEPGGATRRTMVQIDMSWLIILIVYLLVGIIVVTTISTSAVSRLHKLIPVYSFYGYWRIKIPLLLSFNGSNIFKITENKTLMPYF